MKRVFVVIAAVIMLITGFGLVLSPTEPLQSDQAAMAQTKQTSAKEKINQAKKLLADAKKQLEREGKYKCCIEDPCNQCALEHQSCPCMDGLKAGNPVCPECYGGWQRGEGKDKSIKSSDVKTSYSTHRH